MKVVVMALLGILALNVLVILAIVGILVSDRIKARRKERRDRIERKHEENETARA